MFTRARLILTGWYLLIIMCVSVTFSVVLYRGITSEVDRFARIQKLRTERRLHPISLPPDDSVPLFPTPPPLDQDLVNETKTRVIILLSIINAIILAGSGGLGYILAGKTLAPISAMVEEQNRFIGDASHELRTPLTSLKTSLEVALRGEPSLSETKTVLSENLWEVNKLIELSDNLLQLSRFNEKGKVNFRKLVVADIMRDAEKRVMSLAREKKILMKSDISDISVEGDGDSLRNLFSIVLDNAVKYSHPNSTVSLSAVEEKGTVTVRIKDNGMGIDAKDLPHIFNRFYRADRARTKKDTGGYGLGLSIAKRIVEIHNGTIHITSIPAKKTEVVIRLPLRKTEKISFFS